MNDAVPEFLRAASRSSDIAAELAADDLDTLEEFYARVVRLADLEGFHFTAGDLASFVDEQVASCCLPPAHSSAVVVELGHVA